MEGQAFRLGEALREVVRHGIRMLAEEVQVNMVFQGMKQWMEDKGPWLKEQLGNMKNINASTGTLIYLALAFITVFYVLTETTCRYNGVKWVLNNPVPEAVRQEMKQFMLTEDQCKESMSLLRREIDKGLNINTKKSSSVKCWTTYVQEYPTGKESGKFLALDLGGSNFRVLMITLEGSYFNMKSKIYAIAQETMTGPGEQLFDYIAECLYLFTKELSVNESNLPLGFTFSFPLEQVGLKKGILQRWTKGFSCDGVVGQDVVELLKKAVNKRNDLKFETIAVLNDTTGTLMSCAWKNPDTKIGVILGTGTNACYIEKIENVIGFDGDTSRPTVIINLEWGAFGDNGELNFITTEYDKDVDMRSINPGKQIHEKLISGMYLGEIVRVILVKLIKDGVLFGSNLTEEIQRENIFETHNLSTIEGESWGSFSRCKRLMAGFGYPNLSDEECNCVRYICECVSARAAFLASAGIATLMNKMAYPKLTVGIDGTLYKMHPHFKKLMVHKISQLISNDVKEFTLMLSSDGSGRGAALVAASCSSCMNP